VKQLWCEHAWLGGERPEGGVLITLEDDRIESVEPRTSARPGAERLHGLTLPGLANSHSHAFQRALRGRTHGGSGSFWTWREQMYELAGSIDPWSASSITCTTSRAASCTRIRTRWATP
jgi:cytosine/adenosine deaminase-related metal-dependent hydrolase